MSSCLFFSSYFVKSHKPVELKTDNKMTVFNYIALDSNDRRLKWPMAFLDWSQMANGHLSWSQKASHWPFRPRLKGPPWSQMANIS